MLLLNDISMWVSTMRAAGVLYWPCLAFSQPLSSSLFFHILWRYYSLYRQYGVWASGTLPYHAGLGYITSKGLMHKRQTPRNFRHETFWWVYLSVCAKDGLHGWHGTWKWLLFPVDFHASHTVDSCFSSPVVAIKCPFVASFGLCTMSTWKMKHIKIYHREHMLCIDNVAYPNDHSRTKIDTGQRDRL